jgi:hypothetical protein
MPSSLCMWTSDSFRNVFVSVLFTSKGNNYENKVTGLYYSEYILVCTEFRIIFFIKLLPSYIVDHSQAGCQ